MSLVRPRVARRRRRSRLRLGVGAALAILLGNAAVLVGVRLATPAPAAVPLAVARPAVTLTVPPAYPIPGTPPQLPWPAQGQASVEVAGVGGLGSTGAAQPVPVASVAKVMTAYLVLTDHPLDPAADGPTLTVSPAEAAAYPAELAANQSLVRVTAGEVLTERQALEALLLPSADNIARILARWDSGDQATFLGRMNATAAALGMADTRYTDPSGLDKGTVSTAADQVKLAEKALRVPAFAQIVAMPQASIPVAGVVKNYNALLGHDGIVGVKTGSTLAAGGCLVFAARITVAGRDLMLVGAVLGQPGLLYQLLPNVFAATRKLVEAATATVAPHVLVPAGQVVGRRADGTPLVTGADLTVPGWPGLAVPVAAQVSAAGGTLTAGGTSVPVHPRG